MPTLDRARQLVAGYKHGWRMLRVLSDKGSAGLTQKELAGELGISSQNLSKTLATTLRDLERWSVIERHRAGKPTFVCLGPVGQLLLRAGTVHEISAAERKNVFGKREPIADGLKLLRFA